MSISSVPACSWASARSAWGSGTATGRASARQRASDATEVKAGSARRPSGAWMVGTAMSLVLSRRSPSGPVSASPSTATTGTSSRAAGSAATTSSSAARSAA